jgi:hypothetical protein
MNVQKFIAAAAVFVAAGSAFAADTPVAASASAVVIASNLNLPTVSITNSTSRGAVKAEAVEFVKNYKTALAVQLEQYKN